MIAWMIGGPKDQHFWKVGPSPSESCSLFLENGWSSARAALQRRFDEDGASFVDRVRHGGSSGNKELYLT